MGLYKIPLENKKKAFYRLHISISSPEIIYKLSKSRVKRVKKIESLTKIVTSAVGLVFNEYLTQAQYRHHFTE